MATFRNSSTSVDQYTQLEFVAGSRDAYIWLGNQNTTSWAGDGGLNIYTGTGNMDFWTAATQRMRITSGGNVLIGTNTNAGYKLDVNGATRATDFYTSVGLEIQLEIRAYIIQLIILIYIQGKQEFGLLLHLIVL